MYISSCVSVMDVQIFKCLGLHFFHCPFNLYISYTVYIRLYVFRDSPLMVKCESCNNFSSLLIKSQ